MVCLSAFVLAFAGCGTFRDAIDDPGSNIGGGGGGGTTPPSTGYTSTVSIQLETTDKNGETVVTEYTDTDGMTAQWQNATSLMTAEFNEQGFASCAGLDGEYSVTISGLNDDVDEKDPVYYAYNTNAYTTSNNYRDIVITIYEVIIPDRNSSTEGSGPYDPINISDIGIYRTEITYEGQMIYFHFTPRQNGSFSLTSWMNAAEDLVDPVLYAYFGSAQYVNIDNPVIVDDGGTNGKFTSNFRYEVQFSKAMIGGACVFAITAASYTGEFPVEVYFALSYDDDYDRPTTPERVIVPEEEFKNATAEEGTLTYVYEETRVDESGVRYAVFDQDLVGLNPDDGYYHLLDDSGKPNGALLYAYISSASPIYGTAIINVEDDGNNILTIYVGDDRRDYALMLQGYDLAYRKWETIVRSSYQGQPESVIQEVIANRRPGDGSYMGYEDVKGYNDYANIDGMYPVTAELKDFFQLFAKGQMLFMDGMGWVEGSTFNGYHYDAYDDSMWLAFCAYYA